MTIRARRHEATRAESLDAAWAQAEEVGIAGISLRELAATRTTFWSGTVMGNPPRPYTGARRRPDPGDVACLIQTTLEPHMTVIGYLDPGTGTLIVQAVLGGVAGVAVLVKTKGRRLLRRGEAAGDATATTNTTVTAAGSDDEPVATGSSD